MSKKAPRRNHPARSPRKSVMQPVLVTTISRVERMNRCTRHSLCGDRMNRIELMRSCTQCKSSASWLAIWSPELVVSAFFSDRVQGVALANSRIFIEWLAFCDGIWRGVPVFVTDGLPSKWNHVLQCSKCMTFFSSTHCWVLPWIFLYEVSKELNYDLDANPCNLVSAD